ncbi:MAG TPA: right-handed parallel beta-helix repeat-containing protein, partial [Thermoanaerobaculia bacterium]|nr:right-handed parallel beta-helix repeat-containing protein [Thermoanaerobaculia bacterium]
MPEVDLIVLDGEEETIPLSPDEHRRRLAALRRDPSFELVAEERGSVLFGRRASPFRVTAMAALALAATPAIALDVPVSNAPELITAINAAAPGHVITLAPGTYDLGQNLLCDAAGTESQPIVVRAQRLGDALIRFDALEGFKVSAPWWRFENLDVQGVCTDDSDCEHAFHLFGDADHTVIRHNRLHDFNAQIKSNGCCGETFLFPDDVVVEWNELWNAAPRATSNPVTPIDVVGGRRWIVRANYIHDHQKGAGDEISYAAFLKGNSRDGLFERNLVVCEQLHSGGVRLGLSFGGGGSGPPSICEDQTCTPEHQGGIMRNNIIRNCPADVGIYLNEAADVQVHHNLLYANTGIDVRFAATDADLRYNVLSGQIRNRDGGISSETGNLEQVSATQFANWFANPENGDFTLLDGSAIIDLGQPLVSVPDDYCGRLRGDGAPDLGAVEHVAGACDTT